tara:strand:+ start:501 stop:962 length:462 start_codon:yes stop_codon:yes gene_type:complete
MSLEWIKKSIHFRNLLGSHVFGYVKERTARKQKIASLRSKISDEISRENRKKIVRVVKKRREEIDQRIDDQIKNLEKERVEKKRHVRQKHVETHKEYVKRLRKQLSSALLDFRRWTREMHDKLIVYARISGLFPKGRRKNLRKALENARKKDK